MKIWFLLLLVGFCSALAQKSAEADKTSSFTPRYYRVLPAYQVDSLLNNLAKADSCQVVTWQNNDYYFWRFNHLNQEPDLLAIKSKLDSLHYHVYTKAERVSYFGQTVIFPPWQVEVIYDSPVKKTKAQP